MHPTVALAAGVVVGYLARKHFRRGARRVVRVGKRVHSDLGDVLQRLEDDLEPPGGESGQEPEDGACSDAAAPADGVDLAGEEPGPSGLFLYREDGTDIRTLQELLGHSDVKTTEIYTHVLNRGPSGVRSPVDRLLEE